MSRLTELTEQIKNQGTQLWDKIQESPLYTQLSDRYQSLSSTGQKAVQLFAGFLVLFIIFYTPISQLQVSKELIEKFENNRSLIRDMFKAYRETSTGSEVAPPPGSSELISSIQNTLQGAHLIPEQIVSVASSPQAENKLIPKNLLLDVIEVKLNKLNLRQIVEIGTQLVNISYAVKLKDMAISARTDIAGYFDVNYKLYSLKVPEPIPEPPPEPIDTKKSKKKSGDGGGSKSDSDKEKVDE